MSRFARLESTDANDRSKGDPLEDRGGLAPKSPPSSGSAASLDEPAPIGTRSLRAKLEPVSQNEWLPNKAAEGAASVLAGLSPSKGSEATKPDEAKDTKERVEAPEINAVGVLAEADYWFYSGQWDRALRTYSRAIQLDGQLVSAWVGQLHALIRKNQIAECITWVDRALAIFPDHPSLLAMRAVAFAHQGMVRRAIGACDFALSKGATREAWLARGEVLLAASNPNALACLEKAIECAQPDDWKTPLHVGMVLADWKKHALAVEYFRRAVRLKHDFAHGWYYLGLSADRLNLREEAQQTFETACALAPDNQTYKMALHNLRTMGPLARWLRKLRG